MALRTLAHDARALHARFTRAGALALAFACLLPFPTAAHSQVIRIKTAPVADGDQFAFFPSANLGMGGASIALADTMLDPFTNPAKGARLRRGYFMSSPTLFSVSGGSGGGQTLPIGGVARAGSSFAGLVLAAQRISAPHVNEGLVPPIAFDAIATNITTPRPAGTSRTNEYAFLMFGHAFANSGVSIGASALVSGLGAIDGTELLYPGSERVGQSGRASDLRLGLLKEWGGNQSLEALVLHNRFGMKHDVTYQEAFWDPALRQLSTRPLINRDDDQSRTWGMQLKYERPLADSGWRIGALLTANRQSRPKLAGDEIMSIAQDRGRASALDLGLGLSKSLRGSTFAIDAIYQPIWSHTWAEAQASPSPQSTGNFAPGDKVLDNRFVFSNAIVRAGASQEIRLDRETSMRLQLGLQVYSVDYKLDQRELATSITRTHAERWMEWTPTWGWALKLSGLDLQYRGRLTTGVGRTSITQQFGFPLAVGGFGGTRLISSQVAPSSTLGDVHVTTHQLSVSVPIR